MVTSAVAFTSLVVTIVSTVVATTLGVAETETINNGMMR